MYTPYINIINDSETIRDNKNKNKVSITFSGNIKKFVENPIIYNKCFNEKKCCGWVPLTEERKMENSKLKEPLKTIIIGDINGINTISINNMIEWSHKKDTVHICNECGYINKNNSTINSKSKNNKPVNDIEQEENDLRNVPELV